MHFTKNNINKTGWHGAGSECIHNRQAPEPRVCEVRPRWRDIRFPVRQYRAGRRGLGTASGPPHAASTRSAGRGWTEAAANKFHKPHSLVLSPARTTAGAGMDGEH